MPTALERKLVAALLVAGIAIVATALIACSHTKKDSTQYKASCAKRQSLSECNEYSAATLNERRAFLTKTCAVAGGDFHESACAKSEAEVGNCELAGERRHYYADGRMHYTPKAAQHMCSVIEGSWSSVH
jgi:hypothetical protein